MLAYCLLQVTWFVTKLLRKMSTGKSVSASKIIIVTCTAINEDWDKPTPAGPVENAPVGNSRDRGT
jgi:hypothetical protein